MSEHTQGLRLAFTPGLLGLHFVVGSAKYTDEEKGPSDMAYVNSLIEADERQRTIPIAVARYEPNWAERMMEPTPEGDYIALEAYQRKQAEIERLRTVLERIDRQLAGYAQFSPAHELHRLSHHALYGVYPSDVKSVLSEEDSAPNMAKETADNG